MEYIQSTKNERVKAWKKLLTKKHRDQTGTYIIEGEHLITEALKANEVIELIVEGGKEIPSNSSHLPITTITPEISKQISDTKSPQGIFAVCKKREGTIDLSMHTRFLLLDNVQDPGNIGTMIRTADAAGLDAVILGEGSGDVYNPKVIRSAQGSHFHLLIESGNLHDWIEKIHSATIPIYGTALEGAIHYQEVSSSTSFALIVGNEGAGVSKDLLQKTDKNLYIPIYGKSESLNVSIATGILLYHLRE